MRAIEESGPEDWVHEDGHWTYKKDLRVRFEDTSFTMPERSERTFHEPWVEGLGHDEPLRRIFRIYFNSSFVEDVYMVMVDGGRAHILFPNDKGGQDALFVTNWQYRFAKIVGKYADADPEGLGNYLARAGIDVLDG
jgi:hypothetical protein